MQRLLVTLLAFAAATGVNTASVALQQRRACFTRWFGRRGWYAHLALVLPAWGTFLALLLGLGRAVRWPLPQRARPVGTAALAVAALLWLLTFHQLGAARTANGDIFGHDSRPPVRGGPFRFRRNPMYDSYALALVGLALHRANAVYLPLAGASLLLLNQIEARVENRGVHHEDTEGTKARGKAQKANLSC